MDKKELTFASVITQRVVVFLPPIGDQRLENSFIVLRTSHDFSQLQQIATYWLFNKLWL